MIEIRRRMLCNELAKTFENIDMYFVISWVKYTRVIDE